MEQSLTLKERKEINTKMFKVFKEDTHELPAELREILLDDMVTAFQNRINVLIRAQKKRSYQRRVNRKKT